MSMRTHGNAAGASTDPTAIPILIDPREQRMVGTAYHPHPHGTPFDVPYVSHIVGNLWTGGCETGLQLPGEIMHVVNVAPWWQYTAKHSLSSYLQCALHDDEEQAMHQVPALARWVRTCMADGPVLVHCQAGLNRSALVAASALVLAGHSAPDAVSLLRTQRCNPPDYIVRSAVLCNPSFERWLLDDVAQHLV
jgi:hypothetical protein